MSGANAGKLGFAVVALGVAVYLASGMFRSNPADLEKIWRICGDAKCGEEYSFTLGEQKAAVLEKRDLVCPKCGAKERLAAYECAQCKRATPAGMHGAIPKACRHCKAPFPLPKLPGQP